METPLGIYEEAFFPDATRARVTLLMQNDPLWRRFLGLEEDSPNPAFEQGSKGRFYWNHFIFWKVVADYKVISHKENEHLLVDINVSSSRSTFLVTTEEKDGGVLLRFDHRSFTGPKEKAHIRFFRKYWKTLLRSIQKTNQSQ